MKIGDKIVNNDIANNYTITNKASGFVGEVTEIRDEPQIRVKAIKHNIKSVIGLTYPVNSKYFKVVDHTGIEVIVSNPYVYAMLNGKVGISKCREGDTFDEEFGTKIAKAKLDNDNKLVTKLIQEKYSPSKLLDSRGIELKLGDTVVKTNISNCKSSVCKVVNSSTWDCIATNQITGSHNARANDGKPTRGWHVFKLADKEE